VHLGAVAYPADTGIRLVQMPVALRINNLALPL